MNLVMILKKNGRFSKIYAVTDEKYRVEDLTKRNQVITKGIEVGHIFYFGDKF